MSEYKPPLWKRIITGLFGFWGPYRAKKLERIHAEEISIYEGAINGWRHTVAELKELALSYDPNALKSIGYD